MDLVNERTGNIIFNTLKRSCNVTLKGKGDRTQPRNKESMIQQKKERNEGSKTTLYVRSSKEPPTYTLKSKTY